MAQISITLNVKELDDLLTKVEDHCTVECDYCPYYGDTDCKGKVALTLINIGEGE